MMGVLIQRGNLEAGMYTGRMPFEDGDHAAPSRGTTRCRERGLEEILPSALRRSQCCRHLDVGLIACGAVGQHFCYLSSLSILPLGQPEFFQTWERILFCCSKPPSLWSFVWQPQGTDPLPFVTFSGTFRKNIYLFGLYWVLVVVCGI